MLYARYNSTNSTFSGAKTVVATISMPVPAHASLRSPVLTAYQSCVLANAVYLQPVNLAAGSQGLLTTYVVDDYDDKYGVRLALCVPAWFPTQDATGDRPFDFLQVAGEEVHVAFVFRGTGGLRCIRAVAGCHR